MVYALSSDILQPYLSFFWRQDLSLNLESTALASQQASQIHMYLLFLIQMELQITYIPPDFCLGAGEPNSGPHSCTLLTELFPQPLLYLLLCEAEVNYTSLLARTVGNNVSKLCCLKSSMQIDIVT